MGHAPLATVMRGGDCRAPSDDDPTGTIVPSASASARIAAVLLGAEQPADDESAAVSAAVLARRRPGSQVDRHRPGGLGATEEDPALGRLVQRLGVVPHPAVDQAGLAPVAHARAAGPVDPDVAGLGELQQRASAAEPEAGRTDAAGIGEHVGEQDVA
jgi:hypothetical protein